MVRSRCLRRCSARHDYILSTNGSDRKPLSRCHCKYAAINPDASRRCRSSELFAPSQSPEISDDISARDSGAGVGAADGLHKVQTEPPPTNEKNLCGPGASQTEQLLRDGAYPATPSERSKYASRINDGS